MAGHAAQQRIITDIELPGINGVYSTTTTNIGANDEVAREVVARALDGVKVAFEQFPMWWDLRYFPDSRAYRLEFTVVHRTAPEGQWLPPVESGKKRKP